MNSSPFFPPELLSLIPGMWIVVSPAGEIVETNASANTLLAGRSNWKSLAPSETERARLETFFRSPEPRTLTLFVDDDQRLQLEKGAGQVGAGEPQLIRVQDVTASSQDIEELRNRVVQLDRLVNLCRTDRQLIGYEIHDGLVQEMTAAQLFIESGIALLATESPDSAAFPSLQDGANWLRRSIDDARRLIQGLEPPEFETLGLTEAVRQLTKDERLRDVQVTLESNDPLVDLDETLALSVFRMIQEALTNIWKHAEATIATVRMDRQDDCLEISITDDGSGFAPESAAKRFGLKGMQQRALAFGGSLEIRSEQGQGSQLLIEMPVAIRNPI